MEDVRGLADAANASRADALEDCIEHACDEYFIAQ